MRYGPRIKFATASTKDNFTSKSVKIIEKVGGDEYFLNKSIWPDEPKFTNSGMLNTNRKFYCRESQTEYTTPSFWTIVGLGILEYRFLESVI